MTKQTAVPEAAAAAAGLPWTQIATRALCAWKGEGWEAAASSETLAGADALLTRFDGPRSIVMFRVEGVLAGSGAIVIPAGEARAALGLGEEVPLAPAAAELAGALGGSMPDGSTLTVRIGEESTAATAVEIAAALGTAIPSGKLHAVTARITGPNAASFEAEILVERRVFEIGRAFRDLEKIGVGKDRTHEEAPEDPTASAGRLGILMDVELPLIVRLGEAEMTLDEILRFRPGSVIELDKLVDDPAELIVNDTVVAYGEVVVVNENFGLRITRLAETPGGIRP